MKRMPQCHILSYDVNACDMRNSGISNRLVSLPEQLHQHFLLFLSQLVNDIRVQSKPCSLQPLYASQKFNLLNCHWQSITEELSWCASSVNRELDRLPWREWRQKNLKRSSTCSCQHQRQSVDKQHWQYISWKHGVLSYIKSWIKIESWTKWWRQSEFLKSTMGHQWNSQGEQSPEGSPTKPTVHNNTVDTWWWVDEWELYESGQNETYSTTGII